MLQEIIDRIAQPGKNLLTRLRGLFFDATYGLFCDYRTKTLELARITAVSVYLNSIKELRKAAITLFAVAMASAVFAMALVVVPVAIVIVSPWEPTVKIVALLVLGLVDMVAGLVILFHLFSEERWMKITRSQEFIDKIMKGSF